LIAGILATRLDLALGIHGLALGVLAGAVLQVLILLPGLRARNFRYRLTFHLRDRRHNAVR
jgi:peptidoglycan biosynthesis protein MviN/MurJ (putative lipid II flippase)